MNDTPRPFITVGICTRGRVALLERLINCLNQQISVTPGSIELAIVDNNDCPSNEVAKIATTARYKTIVKHEPRAGLVTARNALLDLAQGLETDWLIGVDDDAWMNDDWLLA